MKKLIKKVVIELSGKDVELTLDQAKELQAALNELFGEKTRDIYIPKPHPVPEPYPVIPWRRPYWPRPEPFWKLHCGSEARLSDSSVRLSVKS